jgi:hypothetical protein
MEKYFKIQDDVELSGRWWLDSAHDSHGNEVNSDIFTMARRLDLIPPLIIPLQHPGIALDFTFGSFEMPVLNYRTIKLLEEFTTGIFQCFPVSIENHAGNFFVANFLEIRKCLDETNSEFIKWKKDDHRADKAGQYRQITKLRINPMLAEGWKGVGSLHCILPAEVLRHGFQNLVWNTNTDMRITRCRSLFMLGCDILMTLARR